MVDQQDATELRSGGGAIHLLQAQSLRNRKSGAGDFLDSRSFRKNSVSGYLTIDHSGVIWAATGNGLLRFDRERELFSTYYESDGLPSNSV